MSALSDRLVLMSCLTFARVKLSNYSMIIKAIIDLKCFLNSSLNKFYYSNVYFSQHWCDSTLAVHYLTEDPSVILKAEAEGADSPSRAPSQESNRGPNLRRVVSFTT